MVFAAASDFDVSELFSSDDEDGNADEEASDPRAGMVAHLRANIREKVWSIPVEGGVMTSRLNVAQVSAVTVFGVGVLCWMTCASLTRCYS
jgi:hypothetical protein